MPITQRLLAVSSRELARVNRTLRNEFASGFFVIAAALLGLIAANSPLSSAYFSLRDFEIGPEAWHLHLSLGTWAADGLLAVFFFMVGLELKREFAHGALRNPSTAMVPVLAAIGGVAVPALIYVAFTAGTDSVKGWAIPAATDIAFAIAVLGLIAPRIPPALRVFLLTLAVVDDFIAITIIALFYGDGIEWIWLAIAVVPLALYALIAQLGASWFMKKPWAAWLILLPLGAVVWVLVHHSGIHATIAGVLLAFLVPVGTKTQRDEADMSRNGRRRSIDLAESFGFRFGPLSSGIAVPVFAFFAAGVAINNVSGFPTDPIALGILFGLVLGKPIGITLTTILLTKFTRAKLDGSLREWIGVGSLAGIGFTVALLVADLSFTSPANADLARLAVMVASLVSALAAAALLFRPRVSRRRVAVSRVSVSSAQ